MSPINGYVLRQFLGYFSVLPAGNGEGRERRRPCRGARSGHWGEYMHLSYLTSQRYM